MTTLVLTTKIHKHKGTTKTNACLFEVTGGSKPCHVGRDYHEDPQCPMLLWRVTTCATLPRWAVQIVQYPLYPPPSTLPGPRHWLIQWHRAEKGCARAARACAPSVTRDDLWIMNYDTGEKSFLKREQKEWLIKIGKSRYCTTHTAEERETDLLIVVELVVTMETFDHGNRWSQDWGHVTSAVSCMAV